MKFLLPLILLLFVSLNISAQLPGSEWKFNPPVIPSSMEKLTFSIGDNNFRVPLPDHSLLSHTIQHQPTGQPQKDIRGYTSFVIGTTLIDLQTNASVCHSFMREENGDMHADRF